MFYLSDMFGLSCVQLRRKRQVYLFSSDLFWVFSKNTEIFYRNVLSICRSTATKATGLFLRDPFWVYFKNVGMFYNYFLFFCQSTATKCRMSSVCVCVCVCVCVSTGTSFERLFLTQVSHKRDVFGLHVQKRLVDKKKEIHLSQSDTLQRQTSSACQKETCVSVMTSITCQNMVHIFVHIHTYIQSDTRFFLTQVSHVKIWI